MAAGAQLYDRALRLSRRPSVAARSGRNGDAGATQAFASNLCGFGARRAQSTRNVASHDLLVAKVLHTTIPFTGAIWITAGCGTSAASMELGRVDRLQRPEVNMADTRLGEIARKLLPLLDEFQSEAREVMDENGRRDATILKDYMMRKYPRIVIFLACADTLAELAQHAPG
jgi:hypothetical protein